MEDFMWIEITLRVYFATSDNFVIK